LRTHSVDRTAVTLLFDRVAPEHHLLGGRSLTCPGSASRRPSRGADP
jgi:hypothetical protein